MYIRRKKHFYYLLEIIDFKPSEKGLKNEIEYRAQNLYFPICMNYLNSELLSNAVPFGLQNGKR